jgi:uncharacterized protein
MLRRPGTAKEVEVSLLPAALNLDDPRLVPGTEITVEVQCESLSDGIVVNGRIEAEFHSECRRCLQPVGSVLDIEVHELYQLVVTDPDAFGIQNDQIDLAPMVRETVLIELPDAPLCRIDCAGLCPTCGIDLNREKCGCAAPVIDARWASLDAIRDQLPE